MEVAGPVEVVGVVASATFVVLAAALARRQQLDVERTVLWASVRAASQLLAVGVLLAAMFTARLAMLAMAVGSIKANQAYRMRSLVWSVKKPKRRAA